MKNIAFMHRQVVEDRANKYKSIRRKKRKTISENEASTQDSEILVREQQSNE